MKNRTIIGIICIVLALVVTFAVAPLVNKLADNRTDIVRLTGDVVQGHMISDTDIEIVTVGSYNLPTDVITKKEDVLGKFAAVDLKKGDYLLPSNPMTANTRFILPSKKKKTIISSRRLKSRKTAVSSTAPTPSTPLSIPRPAITTGPLSRISSR